MKISFITTVLNEEKTIGAFLESLMEQTWKPDETVIVDGGSRDETIRKIKNYRARIKKFNLIIRIVELKEANRAVGRNEAIKQATGEIITISDAGCILDKNWVKNIIEPFSDSKVDVVVGFYLPITKTIFEKCLATYTCAMPVKVRPYRPCKFLPSSRSVAFRKIVWEKAGGYPEWLDTCEDLYFARKLQKMGFKFAFAKNALVFWPQQKNLQQAFSQFFRYAVGDGQTLFTPYSVHRPRIIALFARYLIGFLLLVFSLKWNSSFFLFLFLFFAYLFWAILKNYKYIKHWQAPLFLPILQITSDFAVMFGTIKGLIDGKTKN